MLIPAELVALWRGAIDPATEAYSELNREEPQTDYDRACAAAWPGSESQSTAGTEIIGSFPGSGERLVLITLTGGCDPCTEMEREFLKFAKRRPDLQSLIVEAHVQAN